MQTVVTKLPSSVLVKTPIDRGEIKRRLRNVGEYVVSKIPDTCVAVEESKMTKDYTEIVMTTLYGLIFVLFFILSYCDVLDADMGMRFYDYIASKCNTVISAILSALGV